MGKALQAIGEDQQGVRALQKSACMNKGMTAKEAEQTIRKHEQLAKKKAAKEKKEAEHDTEDSAGDQYGRVMNEQIDVKARDDGRSEDERWNMAELFLDQPAPWDSVVAKPGLALTYMMRTRGVCWRARDEEGDWEWQPYCAGRRKPGIEEESDF
jgi:hypothetical protein